MPSLTKLRFLGKAIAIAHRFGGSVEGREAAPFVDRLFSMWSESGYPTERVEAWLESQLEHAFLSFGSAPSWVESEPSWPFEDGSPMVFLSQTSITDEELERTRLSPGETIYVFGIRQPQQSGFRMQYRVVSQFKGISK